MSRDGSGNYSLPAGNPVAPGAVIESSWANATMNDLGQALTQSIAYDGQTLPVSNLPMNGFRHTGVGDPSLRSQYASLGMVQDGRHQRVTITGGTDNLVGTLVGQASAYVAGALVSFFAIATNTGPMTLNYNGIGAKSLVSYDGNPLVGGDVESGGFYMAIYNGSAFVMLSAVSSVDPNAFQSSVSGWLRPVSEVYPNLTIATASTINVPAGEGYIVEPGVSGAANATKISWLQQTITLSYLATTFSTTLAVDINGDIIQIAGPAIGANLRNSAVIGVVQHVNGAATTITTKPAIYGDDGYLYRGVASLLTGQILSGGKVTANGVSPLQLDVSGGLIFQPGANRNQVDSPNTLELPAQANIQFRTLAGEATVGGSLLTTAPVTQYDPNGAGVVTTIPANGDTVIHRLYYLYGQYVWVFGQFIYSNVDDALTRIEVDRSKQITSTRLAGATLLAEIISTKSNTSLNSANGVILSRGSTYFSIGSSGGIGEAPTDGQSYGRKNAAWSTVVDATTPQVTGDLVITKASPKVVQVFDPVGAGTAGLAIKQATYDWYGIEVTEPDDKTYFRSYDPLTGNLRNTTTQDLATGSWSFPDDISVAGDALVTGNAVVTGNVDANNITAAGNVDANNITAAGTVDALLVTADSVTTGDLVATSLNGGPFGRRNLLINGGFDVWQRASSFAGLTVPAYTSDRWRCTPRAFSSPAGTTTVTRNAPVVGVVPGNPDYVLSFSQTVGAANGARLGQPVEGLRRFSGQTVTFSALIRVSSGTASVRPDMQLFYGTGGTATEDVLGTAWTVTTSWVRYTQTLTVPDLAAKTFGTDPYLSVSFTLLNGYVGTVEFANVQAEIGEVATPFEVLPIGETMALCQRYYAAGRAFLEAYGAASQSLSSAIFFPVTMRAAPTTVLTNSGSAFTNGVFSASTVTTGGLRLVTTKDGTSGAFLASATWTADSEL